MKLSRRAVLALAGGCAAPAIVGHPFGLRARPFVDEPFTLGIASGDPSSDGFVLWTRLAPQPLDERGGMAPEPVRVVFEVARDEAMRDVVCTGETYARVEAAHTVHVEIVGLESGRDYFYRLRAGPAESPVGRARTLPAPGAAVPRLRFGAAGCQAFEDGLYTAWRHIADDHLDFVVHYGDYIYEDPPRSTGSGRVPIARTMPADFGRCRTLSDYRRRYALYKTDPDLRAAHASCPFLPSFDDHEVANDWAGRTGWDGTSPAAFLARRAAAFQAWCEHMPVRRAQIANGPDLEAYRRFRIGALVELMVLDTRQYRTPQACGGGFAAVCRAAEAPDRTMMGRTQERWLARTLRSAARETVWQAFAQQVLFSPVEMGRIPWLREAIPGVRNLDAWDGAPAARARLLALWRACRCTNPVVLSGDAHLGMALEIPADGRTPGDRSVGVEFLATSISSGGDGRPDAAFDGLRTDNPHLRLVDDRRGYIRHVVEPTTWEADYRMLDRVSVAGGTVTSSRRFVVEAGRPALGLA